MVGQLAPAAMAGEPAAGSIVLVGPPLSCSGPSMGSAMVTVAAHIVPPAGNCKLAPLAPWVLAQLVVLSSVPRALSARMQLASVTPVSPPKSPSPVLPATVTLVNEPVTPLANQTPPPPAAVLLAMVTLVRLAMADCPIQMPPPKWPVLFERVEPLRLIFTCSR